MIERKQTRAIHVGNLQIGGDAHIVIQSMTNTKTKDVDATLKQINALANAGCELVRLAILDQEDADAVAKIKQLSPVPLVADIHFNPAFAISVIKNGIDKVRLNPGNLPLDSVPEIARLAKEHHVPIRIGINTGSLEKSLIAKYGGPCPEAMIESAKHHIDILTQCDFHDIALSFKSSDVSLCIDTYRLASQTFDYPLHLGVTEAGTMLGSSIKSSVALGTLLYDGIGDTIRVSVSADPVEEIKIAKQLLKCLNLKKDVVNLISCPTCGRIQYDMLPIVAQIEDFVNNIQEDITVAIMGCPVNGPQEASRADIGIAGGKDVGLLFKKGEIIATVPQEEIVERLKQEILALVEQKHKV